MRSASMVERPERERLWWFTCPDGHLGLIDEGQYHGEYSIQCDQCAFHGYVTEGYVDGKKE